MRQKGKSHLSPPCSEVYVAKNEILSFAGKWMELENIISSEVSQVEDKICMFFLICGI
jgi:hypothetical protein